MENKNIPCKLLASIVKHYFGKRKFFVEIVDKDIIYFPYTYAKVFY